MPSSRYHPVLVTLHWLHALMIIAALTLGFSVLAAMPNSDPKKMGILQAHMAGGMLILVLMSICFIVRDAGGETGDDRSSATR